MLPFKIKQIVMAQAPEDKRYYLARIIDKNETRYQLYYFHKRKRALQPAYTVRLPTQEELEAQIAVYGEMLNTNDICQTAERRGPGRPRKIAAEMQTTVWDDTAQDAPVQQAPVPVVPAVDQDELRKLFAEFSEKCTGEQKIALENLQAQTRDWLNQEHEKVTKIIERLENTKPYQTIRLLTPENKIRKLDNEQTHTHFEKLLTFCQARDAQGNRLNIWLSGEASSGKTTGCKQVAQALKLKWYFNGAISMPHELLGFIDANGNYHTTPFRQAYEHGGLYTLDEADRCDPIALLAVNPHIAGTVATFPDKQVKRHPDFILTATANTWGLGGTSDYVGATKLDAAFMSHFSVRLDWNIDPELEIRICGHKEWAEHVQKIRLKAKQAGLKVLIDTRMSIAGAALIAAGLTFEQAAESTYLANLTAEQRRILNLI